MVRGNNRDASSNGAAAAAVEDALGIVSFRSLNVAAVRQCLAGISP